MRSGSTWLRLTAASALLGLMGCSDEGSGGQGQTGASGAGAPSAPVVGGAGSPAAGSSGAGASAGASGGAAGRGTAPPAAGSGGRGAAGSPSSAGSSAAAGGGSGNGAAGSASGAGGADASGSGGAGTGTGTGTGGTGAAGSGTQPSAAFPDVTDLGAKGPFTAVTTENSGPGGGYTVYAPQELGKDGLKHPFLTWGNGATTVPALFSLLPHLATHGFVVIASNNAFVTGPELLAGIDWLSMENDRAGSTFHQKLDPARVASFGYSLGSLGTFEIAADPRLKTTVHISGGAMNKSVVPNLKNPAAFLCGDDSDIANANCDTDFTMATVPVFYAQFPGDHLGILGAFAGQLSEATTGWLRWRLMGDKKLDAMFVGPNCTLCKDTRWVVQQKMLDVPPP